MSRPVTAEAVLDHIEPGADVIVGTINGEPIGIIDALEANHEQLDGVRLHQMHSEHPRPSIYGEYGDHLRHVSYFLSHVTRPAYWAGQCDLVPNHFSELPHLLRTETKCSLVVAAVSPPDRHGYFSLGTTADYIGGADRQGAVLRRGQPPDAAHAGAQPDPRLPGARLVRARRAADRDPADGAGRARPPDRRADRRADPERRHAAGRCRRRSRTPCSRRCAIIAISASTPRCCPTASVDLVDRGIVTCTRKKLRPNKIVTTLALGTHGAVRVAAREPARSSSCPSTTSTTRASSPRSTRSISINATTEVDLFGQCASETVAGRYWSSSGGQADFARGAMYSEGGQAFIVLHSTTRKGVSRIRVRLTEGSVVTTLKNTVDNVVTEWGIAKLRGRSIAERARGARRHRAPGPPGRARGRSARGRDLGHPRTDAPAGELAGGPRVVQASTCN